MGSHSRTRLKQPSSSSSNLLSSWFPRCPAVERVFRQPPDPLPTWERIFSLFCWRTCAPCGQPHHRTRGLATSPKEPQEVPTTLD